MREFLLILTIIIVWWLFLINFASLLYWMDKKCSDETRFINNNYITGLWFQLSCLWDNQEADNTIISPHRTDREKKIDRIATEACLEQWWIPAISRWDWDIICD